MEHRWGSRIALDRPVRLSARPLAIGTGRICNLSLSGAWISTNLPLAPGAVVRLSEGQAGDPEELGAAIEACVVRCDETGIGIEWCEAAPSLVLQWLQRTGDPSASVRRRAGS